MDFFLVTSFNQLEKQPDLKQLLYENYAIASEGKGYILFDLHAPK
jgi:hypothetical protein